MGLKYSVKESPEDSEFKGSVLERVEGSEIGFMFGEEIVYMLVFYKDFSAFDSEIEERV
jgi:hypothetical protein